MYATLYRGLVLNQGIQRSFFFEVISYIGGAGRVLIFQFKHPLPREPYHECRNLVVALDEDSMHMLFEHVFFGPSPSRAPQDFISLVDRVGIAYGYNWSFRIFQARQLFLCWPEP